MRGVSLRALSALALAAAATSAHAGDPSELIANAHASAVGGCPCGDSQDQTLHTAVNAPLSSNASDVTAGTGSFAHASVTTEFGVQRVYADAFLAAGDLNPDAQAVAYSRYIEYYAAGALGGSGVLSFVITGSHTPNAGIIGPGTDAELSWDLEDVTTNFSLGSGTWSATDVAPTPVTFSYVVPMTDIIALRVDFSASAYAGQRANPFLVYADYSHTVLTYLDAGAGAPDVVGLSGHDYATPSAAVGGVPEPAAWGLMLVGFAGLGATLRRRRERRTLECA